MKYLLNNYLTNANQKNNLLVKQMLSNSIDKKLYNNKLTCY
jgi:hypothetical protein